MLTYVLANVCICNLGMRRNAQESDILLNRKSSRRRSEFCDCYKGSHYDDTHSIVYELQNVDIFQKHLTSLLEGPKFRIDRSFILSCLPFYKKII